MPCSDPKSWEDEEERSIAAPVLCNLVRAFGIRVVTEALDRECGVDPERVAQWWKRHLAQDVERRKRDRSPVGRLNPLHWTLDHRPRAERQA